MLKPITAAALLSATLATAAFAAEAMKVGETGKGKTLTNSAGMTLYTFDKDAAGATMALGNGRITAALFIPGARTPSRATPPATAF